MTQQKWIITACRKGRRLIPALLICPLYPDIFCAPVEIGNQTMTGEGGVRSKGEWLVGKAI